MTSEDRKTPLLLSLLILYVGSSIDESHGIWFSFLHEKALANVGCAILVVATLTTIYSRLILVLMDIFLFLP